MGEASGTRDGISSTGEVDGESIAVDCLAGDVPCVDGLLGMDCAFGMFVVFCMDGDGR